MRLRKDYILRELGDTRLLINEGEQVRLTRVLPLNESAAFLWRRAEGRDFDTDWLAQQLVEEYGIDAATAAADAEDMVRSWKENRLLAP